MEPATRDLSAAAVEFDQLAVAWLTMFVVGSDLFVISPLLPLIAADYAVTPAAAGWSVTVFAVTYMLSAPLLGHIADRIGRGRVLTYCLCAFGAANLLTAIAGNFSWLLVTRIAAGAAAAGVSPSVYALAGASGPPEQRASRLAIVVSGLLMSLSFGTPVGLLTAASFCWPAVFFVLGALSLLLAWANHRVWYHPATPRSGATPEERLTPAVVAARLAPTVLLHLSRGRLARIGIFDRRNRAGDPVLWERGDCRHPPGRAHCRPFGSKTDHLDWSAGTLLESFAAADRAEFGDACQLRLWTRLVVGAVVLPGSAAQAGQPVSPQPSSNSRLEQQRPVFGHLAGLFGGWASRYPRRL